jgi:hypothetical protein
MRFENLQANFKFILFEVSFDFLISFTKVRNSKLLSMIFFSEFSAKILEFCKGQISKHGKQRLQLSEAENSLL